jgi:uncharacterized membrane protein YdjX (TVP38/TMEM64 family)
MKVRGWHVLVVITAAAIVLSKLLIEDVYGLTWSEVLTRLVAPSPGSALIIFGLLTVDLLVPVPSSVVMILSGAIFGVVPGGCLSLVGSFAGNYLGFELARRYGRRAANRFVGAVQLDRLQQTFSGHGALAVVVSRPLPIMMETLSVVAGLSGMRRSTFVGASVAGTTPVAFVYAYAGSRAITEGTIVPAIVILITVVAAGWLLARPLLRIPHLSLQEWTQSVRDPSGRSK